MAESLKVGDNGVAFVEAWVCDQPARGAKYQVLRDEWVKDYTVRLIHEIAVEAPVVDHALARAQAAALAEATADHYRARIARNEVAEKAAKHG